MHTALKTMLKEDIMSLRLLQYGGQIQWEHISS